MKMSSSWMLLITLLFSWASAITTESSRGLHVAKDFSDGKNLSREVIYLSKNEDAASNSNDDFDGVRKSSIELPISELTDDKLVIEYQNLVNNQIDAADLAPSEPFDGGNHSIEHNRKRTKSCPPGCRSFRIDNDDPPRCRCIRELTNVPGPVWNLTLESVSAQKFSIRFEPPPETHTGIVNYTVIVKVIKYFGCEELNRKSPSQSYEYLNKWTHWFFSAFYPYVQYHVTVMANTISGQGPPLSIVFETPPLDIPVSKVSNLRLANESTLAWNPPEDCKTITGPEKVTRLDFSCLSEWGKNWNASHETTGYEFDLKSLNLSPFTRYKVCAYVIRDFHKPVNESNCQELQWTTEAIMPGPVRNSTLESVFAHNFSIRFEPPPGTHTGFVNFTVIIELIKYFGCEELNRKSPSESYKYLNERTGLIVWNLHPYVQYNVTAMANTASGQGPPVSIVVETLPLDIPVSKVGNLRLANESTLAWDPPEDCTTITGPEKVTRLDFSCLSAWGQNWNASHETTDYEFDLKRLNLSPSTRYKVCAYVIRDFHKPVNESNCQELQWTTESVVPGPVWNLTLESVFAHNFSIRFEPPPETHTGIVNFTVIVKLIKHLGCEELNRNSPSESHEWLRDWTRWSIYINHPYAQYNVTVMANTISGRGPPVSIVVVTLPLDIPVSKVSNLRLANESTLAWDPPEDCTTITGPEKVTRLDFSCLSAWGQNWNASHETTDYEFDLKRLNLSPSTRYKVCAYVIRDFHKPVNESNCQELQWTTESVVPGPVWNLTLESVFAHNFSIRFEPPPETHTGIVNFTVIVKLIKHLGCEELNRNSPSESHEWLRDWTRWSIYINHPYAQYNVTVMANTISGRGPPVSIVVVTLPLDIPVSKVSNLRLANESTLAWDPPEDCTTITGPEKVTRLDFSCLSAWGQNWNASHETTDYEFDLKRLNLSPSTRYKVCAYVIRDFHKPVNESNCQELQWTTESVVPGPVRNSTLESVFAHNFSIRFEPPPGTHTGFVNFTVIIELIKYFGCEELNRKSPSESYKYLNERTGLIVWNLHPYVQYNVTAMANTASGQGPPVSIVVETLPLDIPVSKVSNLRLANESTLAWDPPEDCKTITGPEKVTRLDLSCLSDWGRNWHITKETSDYKFDLERLKLLPSTRYKVCAYLIRDYGKPINRSNCQELEWTTESARPPAVKKFDVYNANAAEHTISVRWESSTPTYGEIESYQVSLVIGNLVVQKRTVKVSELEKCTENYLCLRNWTLPSNVSTNDVIKLKIFAKNTLLDKNGVEIMKLFTLDELYNKGDVGLDILPRKQNTISIPRSTSLQFTMIQVLFNATT